MHRRLMMTLAAVLTASLLLSACGRKLEGIYRDQIGVIELAFKGNKVKMMGIELDYEVDGDEVKIASPQGTLTFDIQEDGSLRNGLLGTLKRKP